MKEAAGRQFVSKQSHQIVLRLHGDELKRETGGSAIEGAAMESDLV
jgi:hypothetical protein